VTAGRVVLLMTTPRAAPGVLTWPAWQVLREADVVLAADPDASTTAALAEAGVDLQPERGEPATPAGRAGRLLAAASAGREVVWLTAPDGDPGLSTALAAALARWEGAGREGAGPPAVEVLTGCYDLPGARLLDLVAVMDRLRSPGGCPWDAEQTHDSLRPHLLEETYELLEALDAGDRPAMREELGDVLLQVAFHARLAAEDAQAPFDLDDVAGDVVAKLVRRHPHVFAEEGEAAGSAQDVHERWHRLKAEEKRRASVLDGVPVALPALARAQAVLGRLDRMAPAHPSSGAAGGAARRPVAPAPVAEQAVAARLLDGVDAARHAGVDAEGALRRLVQQMERRARAREREDRPGAG
jgi:XTP/dITP diphosphohydrolase